MKTRTRPIPWLPLALASLVGLAFVGSSPGG